MLQPQYFHSKSGRFIENETSVEPEKKQTRDIDAIKEMEAEEIQIPYFINAAQSQRPSFFSSSLQQTDIIDVCLLRA